MKQQHNLRSKTTALAVVLVLTAAVPLAVAAVTSAQGNSLQKVKVVRQNATNTTSSTTWVDIPGAVTTFTVPSYYEHLFIARFAAETSCYGAPGYCKVRVLVNGLEMEPVVGSEYAFDSSDNGTETSSSWEGHAVERSKTVCGSFSNVTVKVQYSVSVPTVTFRLDDWHLTVEQFPTGGACVF
jgi:hypothetical protein